MLRSILTVFMLPVLLLLGSGSNNSAAGSKQKSTEIQTERVEKLIVVNGSATIDVDLSRLNDAPATDESLEVRLRLEASQNRRALLLVGISEGPASPIILVSNQFMLRMGQTVDVQCDLERLPLPGGRYFLWVGAFVRNKDLLPWHPVASFEVFGPRLDQGLPGSSDRPNAHPRR